MRYLLSVVLVVLSGCASQSELYNRYADVGETCDEIKAEMLVLSGQAADITDMSNSKQVAVVGSQLAVAAGWFPPALALTPMIIGSVEINNYSQVNRVDYLAKVGAIRGVSLSQLGVYDDSRTT